RTLCRRERAHHLELHRHRRWRRRGRPPRRHLPDNRKEHSMRAARRLMLGASILAALIAPAGATAAGPDITRVSFEDRYVDTQTCPGMDLDTQLKASVAIQLFSATRAQVHQP